MEQNEKNAFIPEVNSELYKSYNVKLFRMIPKNAKLICQNVLTGKVTVKNSGFRFVLPWYRSKLVNVTKTVIDYPAEKYLTNEGIYVEIDPALTVRIADPYKFEYENTNPIQELGILVKDVIRSFVESKSAQELIGRNYSIDEKDPGNLFNAFEARTGLHVSHLSFKNIKLPQALVDDYEKAKTQELENKRAIAEAKSKREQAEINAEAQKISAEAEAYRQNAILNATISVLAGKGYDEKIIAEVIKTVLISGSNASVIANLGASNGPEAAATMVIKALENINKESTGKPLTRVRKKEDVSEDSISDM